MMRVRTADAEWLFEAGRFMRVAPGDNRGLCLWRDYAGWHIDTKGRLHVQLPAEPMLCSARIVATGAVLGDSSAQGPEAQSCTLCGEPVWGAATHPCCARHEAEILAGRPCLACEASRAAGRRKSWSR